MVLKHTSGVLLRAEPSAKVYQFRCLMGVPKRIMKPLTMHPEDMCMKHVYDLMLGRAQGLEAIRNQRDFTVEVIMLRHNDDEHNTKATAAIYAC